jgi:hypothetical protein
VFFLGFDFLVMAFVFIFTLLLFNLTSAFDAKEIGGRSIREEKVYSFPRIYNATIVKSNTFGLFASEVDLIEFGQNDRIEAFNISFLVHDDEELTYVTSLATLSKMNVVNQRIQFDLKATLDLHQQINYVGPKVKSSSEYSKIAGFPCYKNLKGSFDWMNAMVKRSKSIPGLTVTKTDIGDSWLKQQNSSQGYDIWVLKVTGMSAPHSSSSSSIESVTSPKAIFFIMAGLHARKFTPTDWPLDG